mmetsp:Transcript_31722/g.72805  ORF Transcript_31722/g.72805 Transcript_31722/m.72805 type:complete len:106 (+) Transcript_31722:1389-1706(+)
MATVCGYYTENWGYVHTNCPVSCKSCRPENADISDCCVTDHYFSGREGCNDRECQVLVCTIDDICCKYNWDLVCVVHAEVECKKCKVKASAPQGSLIRAALKPEN